MYGILLIGKGVNMGIIINLNLNVKTWLTDSFVGVRPNSWKIEWGKAHWAADTL